MTGTKTFLLELHCEEIPARFLAPLAGDFYTKLLSWAVRSNLRREEDVPTLVIPHELSGIIFFSPRKIAFDSGGRSYGSRVSSPTSTIRPS